MRDKKAFLSDQCKEIEENNRMGKTRDFLKKIRDIKGTLHAKMGSIKDRNGLDLIEAEDIKKRTISETSRTMLNTPTFKSQESQKKNYYNVGADDHIYLFIERKENK